ncbi:MAG: hypothetical protein FWC16_10210 [Defluviitaleaceae bacterium]|nr:hypothetical protein [Defluviitaleaceae bacterium]MCL2275289.1 hypothetical protein [Defluviitaleaceae bacterium]
MASLRRWVRKNNQKLGFGIFVITIILNNIFDFPRLFGQISLSWIFTVVLFALINWHVFPLY